MNLEQRYRTILLFGAPGTGKGTQGKILGTVPGFFHLSCGEVFRTLDIHQNLGRVFFEYSSRGELVPDDITIQLWKENINAQSVLGHYKPYRELLILDGIPRNRTQAELLDKYIGVFKIIHLTCGDEEEMMKRIRQRALKDNRHDDSQPDVIRRRLELYREETQPVLDYYDSELISEVDANRSPAEVLERVVHLLVPIQNEHFGNIFADAMPQRALG